MSGKVISATIDDIWDEIGQRLLAPADVEVYFELMQCQKTQWQQWLQKSGIAFIKAPTEAEAATMYFEQEHNVAIKNFRETREDIITCEACGVCRTGTSYFATVSANDIPSMLREGWKRVPSPDTAITNN